MPEEDAARMDTNAPHTHDDVAGEGAPALDRHQEVADEVAQLLSLGHHHAAERALVRGGGAVLPDLPLRFGMVLRAVRQRASRDLVVAVREGRTVTLTLDDPGDGPILVRWDAQVVGQLAGHDTALVRAFGERRALYTPRLLELAIRGDRVHTIAVEMTRPELRECDRCGAMHADAFVVCDACRGVTGEAPPVHVAGAVEALASEQARRQRSEDDEETDGDPSERRRRGHERPPGTHTT